MASSSFSSSSSSLVYAVYCHDGDQLIGEACSDTHYEYSRDPKNFDAHYYAIYAVPLPEPVPDLIPPEKKLKLSLSPSPSPQQEQLNPVATLSLSKFPASMGFAAIGSCIYMIGGYLKSAPSLEVYIIDTSRLPSPSLELDPCNVPRGPPLNNPKRCPAVVSLFGKIFAIPHQFNPRSWKSDGHCAEFLAFDSASASNKWQCIPNPQYMEEKGLLVRSCNIVGSFIVITIVQGPVYELDATKPLEGWKESARFTSPNMVALVGNSEVINGLLCLHEQFSYVAGFSFMACLLPDLEHDAGKFPELVWVFHPDNWKAGGEINPGGRVVLNIGDGRAAVLTHGFTGAQSHSLVLHFILDIVSLEKFKLEDEGRRGEPAVNVYQLETVDYEIGKVNTTHGCLCCCFRMLGSSKAFATTPSVAWYSDTIVISRYKKFMRVN